MEDMERYIRLPWSVMSAMPDVRTRWTRSVAGLRETAARGWRKEQSGPVKERLPGQRSPWHTVTSLRITQG